MGKNIDTYFAKFPDIPHPDALREGRRNVRVVMVGASTPDTTFKSIHPLAEDAPEYALVGKIAVEWANLETKIDQQIWAMCPMPHKIAACLTAQLIGPAPRFNALISICRELGFSKAVVESVEEFKEHACGVAEQRNRMVHDSWLVEAAVVEAAQDDDRRAVKNTITAKGQLKMTREPVTKEEMERVIYKIRRLIDVFEIAIAGEMLRSGS